MDADVDGSSVTLKELGAHRTFMFDRVFDAASPVRTSLAEVDALVGFNSNLHDHFFLAL